MTDQLDPTGINATGVDLDGDSVPDLTAFDLDNDNISDAISTLDEKRTAWVNADGHPGWDLVFRDFNVDGAVGATMADLDQDGFFEKLQLADGTVFTLDPATGMVVSAEGPRRLPSSLPGARPGADRGARVGAGHPDRGTGGPGGPGRPRRQPGPGAEPAPGPAPGAAAPEPEPDPNQPGGDRLPARGTAAAGAEPDPEPARGARLLARGTAAPGTAARGAAAPEPEPDPEPARGARLPARGTAAARAAAAGAEPDPGPAGCARLRPGRGADLPGAAGHRVDGRARHLGQRRRRDGTAEYQSRTASGPVSIAMVVSEFLGQVVPEKDAVSRAVDLGVLTYAPGSEFGDWDGMTVYEVETMIESYGIPAHVEGTGEETPAQAMDRIREDSRPRTGA